MASDLNCLSTQCSSSMAPELWHNVGKQTSRLHGDQNPSIYKAFPGTLLCGGHGLYFGEFWAMHAFGPNQGSRVKETEGEFTAPDRMGEACSSGRRALGLRDKTGTFTPAKGANGGLAQTGVHQAAYGASAARHRALSTSFRTGPSKGSWASPQEDLDTSMGALGSGAWASAPSAHLNTLRNSSMGVCAVWSIDLGQAFHVICAQGPRG